MEANVTLLYRYLQHQPANTKRDAVPHTFPLHAHGQALLIAAVLAAVALAFVH